MLDYFEIDWASTLKLDEKNYNSATNNFLDTINSVLNKNAPLKKLISINLDLKINLGSLLVFKNQYMLKTNY